MALMSLASTRSVRSNDEAQGSLQSWHLSLHVEGIMLLTWLYCASASRCCESGTGANPSAIAAPDGIGDYHEALLVQSVLQG